MEKWNELARELRKEPMILGYRVTGGDLKNVYDAGLAIKKELHGEIIAFRGLWHIKGNDCVEMRSFWVKPEYRGQRLGSAIMDEIYSLFPPGKTIFVVTQNPKVIHLLQRHKWQEATIADWEEIVPWKASCGPCDQVSEENKKDCPYKAREGGCMMFYYKVKP